MHRGDIKYYLKVIRKSYKNISAIIGLANFVMIVLCGLFVFVLLVYEPANQWHTTTFTLSHYEYRYASGGGVLDIYTTDNRRYALNHNEGEIRHQLIEGQRYKAVYSDDLFHDIIKGLEDSECEYLDVDEMRELHKTERTWFAGLLITCISLLLILNSAYAISSLQEEKRRIQSRIRKKLRH